MRRNRSQTAKRRSHHAISAARASRCDCGALRVSHRACPSCGKYNGRVVVDVVAKEKRLARRAKKRQTELRESGQAADPKEEKTASA